MKFDGVTKLNAQVIMVELFFEIATFSETDRNCVCFELAGLDGKISYPEINEI